ncbi:hypothetical protein [Mangrovibacillus cuniculi]|uniref:Uncharacterized protein n=1 Tax=Mangrovibacillus cuniculi TaxID=2593652 RepID=A0A7S8CDB8_9BACI|nr:hypothetical protein [Mangrovibacillus cuniculi]QPC47889.1 hypothetical protein G8O30_13425 [Mangrovibacillus cuniculi]
MNLSITFFVILILSILLFFTFFSMRRWFKPIEIFLLFLFTSYLCQHLFYTLSSPYDRLRVVEDHLPFWTVRLQYGVVFAITLLWLMVIYRLNWTLFRKLTATFAWILFWVIVEKTFLILGVLESQSISWYPSLDMFFSMLVILLTLFFTNLLQQVLRKERII